MFNKRKKACAALILAMVFRHKQRTKKNRKWVREWLKKRSDLSHVNLLSQIRTTDPKYFINYFRMSPASYDKLLMLIRDKIEKQDTVMRHAIPVDERLGVTLRFLATGRSFECLKFSALISANTISEIVLETCEAIISALRGYIQVPKTEEEWEDVARDFGIRWNFFNCLGSIDGKHIRIKKPINSGSLFHNYKGYFSVVLMAVVDAQYRFLSVDVGVNGRISDGGVIRRTTFWQLYENGSLNIPQPDFLPNSDEKFPFVFVTDDAFALQTNFMKPYHMNGLDKTKRVFNYRLSRARRVVENAFGILVSKFAIFQKDIQLEPEKVNIITMACCHLHNYIMQENPVSYLHGVVNTEDNTTGNIIRGTDRVNTELLQLQRGRFLNATTAAKNVRENFARYFSNKGKVPWQDNVIS